MKKIVIIGGGIAGIAAGIYGKKAGYEVDIYEKNPIAGGECMGWNRNGHHIDNCIHWLTGTKKGTSLRKVWEDVGALDSNTTFAKTEAFYTSCYHGQEVTLWNDLDRAERELLLLSPKDTHEIKKFIEHVRYAESCQVPSDKPMDMMGIKDYIVMGKSMANMPKVIKEYGKIDLADLGARFQHPALKRLFTDYLPEEYIASSFIVSYATITSGNGGIPAKGSLAMVNRMIDKFKSLGGNLYCNASVQKILIKNKTAYGILLDNQKEVLADYIISAADTNVLFNNLIGTQYLNKKWKKVYQDSNRYPLVSGFQIACSIDLSAYTKKDTVFFDCAPFTIGNQTVSRISVKSYKYEPDFAPSGKTILQSNVAQYDADFQYWEQLSDEEYKKKKNELATTLISRIIAQFPELEGHISLLDCWTPLTYKKYCNAYHGAYMSFITKKTEKSFRVKGIVKGVKNLYIASQWIMAPGGLPVAVTSGKFSIQRILKKEKKKYVNI